MDTLFRLVSLQQSSDHHQQQSSFNSSRTSSTSSHHLFYQPPPQEEECYNNYYHHQQQHHLYMDEDFSSSSSSKHHHPPPPPPPPPSTTPLFDPAEFSLPHHVPAALNLDFSSPSSSSSSAPNAGRWATDLLLSCAQAVASRDNTQVQKLMWMLNELSSPYGDADQKLASYFLQALFARITASGPRTLHTLSAASDRTCSFDSTRRVALRFQDLSPWHSFGHVASNGAILESFLAASSPAARLHILDLSTTFCTQWPTLLEALATRSSDDTPHLSITTVVSPSSAASSSSHRVMKEIAARMEKFARLMGVPFKFHTIHHDGDVSNLDFSSLDLREGGAAALAVNCVNSLHGVPSHRRDALMSAIRRLQPRIVTVVEEEADLTDDDDEAFVRVFGEGVRFFSAYFDSLEESFPRASNERLALERAAGRAVVDLVACPAAESRERRETAAGWSRRMRATGFEPVAFSDDVLDDVRALLRRYREGWSMRTAAEELDGGGGATAGIFLSWKEQPVVWASAWRP